MDTDSQISQSWIDNADAWVDAVREGRIPSRRAGTDAAVIAAVQETHPATVLDAGCGEGWLARALAAHGIRVVAFDGSDALIQRATELGGADFLHLGYEEFIAHPQRAGSSFDVVVFNFSLFADDIVPVLRAARAVVRDGGRLIIQTVHPFNDSQADPYVDGWRVETFATMSDAFQTPMPWYFRTMESWVRSVREAGFTLEALREPVNPDTGKPLSLLLIATR